MGDANVRGGGTSSHRKEKRKGGEERDSLKSGGGGDAPSPHELKTAGGHSHGATDHTQFTFLTTEESLEFEETLIVLANWPFDDSVNGFTRLKEVVGEEWTKAHGYRTVREMEANDTIGLTTNTEGQAHDRELAKGLIHAMLLSFRYTSFFTQVRSMVVDRMRLSNVCHDTWSPEPQFICEWLAIFFHWLFEELGKAPPVGAPGVGTLADYREKEPHGYVPSLKGVVEQEPEPRDLGGEGREVAQKADETGGNVGSLEVGREGGGKTIGGDRRQDLMEEKKSKPAEPRCSACGMPHHTAGECRLVSIGHPDAVKCARDPTQWKGVWDTLQLDGKAALNLYRLCDGTLWEPSEEEAKRRDDFYPGATKKYQKLKKEASKQPPAPPGKALPASKRQEHMQPHQPQQTMQIFITTLDGGNIVLEVEPTDTIDNLRRKIEDRLGVPTANQRLTSSGQELKMAKRTLRDYKVRNESVVHLTLRTLGGSSAGARGQTTAEAYHPGDRVTLTLSNGARLGGTVVGGMDIGGQYTYNVMIDGEDEAREDVPEHKLKMVTAPRATEVFEAFDRVWIVLPNGDSHQGAVMACTAPGRYSVRMDTGDRQEGVPGNALSRVGPIQQVRTVQEPGYKTEEGGGGGKANSTTRAEAKDEAHSSAYDQRLFAAGAASATDRRRRRREEDEEEGEGRSPGRRRRDSEQSDMAQQRGATRSDTQIATQHFEGQEFSRGHNRPERERNRQGTQEGIETHPPPPTLASPPPHQTRARPTPLQDAANRSAERRLMQATMGSSPPTATLSDTELVTQHLDVQEHFRGHNRLERENNGQGAQSPRAPPPQMGISDPPPPAFGSPADRLMDLLNGPPEERGHGEGGQGAIAALLEELLARGGGGGGGEEGGAAGEGGEGTDSDGGTACATVATVSAWSRRGTRHTGRSQASRGRRTSGSTRTTKQRLSLCPPATRTGTDGGGIWA